MKSETIANYCFRKAGFVMVEIEENDDYDCDDDDKSARLSVPEEWSKFQEHFNCEETDFETYLKVDSDIIFAECLPEKESVNATVPECEESEEKIENSVREEDSGNEINLKPTSDQALIAVDILRMYIHGHSAVIGSVFSALNVVENFVEETRVQNFKQKKMTDFFKQ